MQWDPESVQYDEQELSFPSSIKLVKYATNRKGILGYSRPASHKYGRLYSGKECEFS